MSFSDPEAVARYAENPPRLVPGFAALQRMAGQLIAERAGEDARVLVLGAGGGLEMKVFAEAHPGWRFTGIDPSAEMLKLAVQTMGGLSSRAELHEGYIETAPPGPFDAAACILTLHFVKDRAGTLAEIAKRLKPGAPLVVAHHSFPQSEPEKSLWLSRFVDFAVSSGLPRDKVQAGIAAIGQLPIVAPEQDEALLKAAGFFDVGLFYAALTFRGWVAYR